MVPGLTPTAPSASLAEGLKFWGRRREQFLASPLASAALSFAFCVPSCPAAPLASRTQAPERASSLPGGQRQAEQVEGERGGRSWQGRPRVGTQCDRRKGTARNVERRGVLHSQAQREGDGKRRIQERETITGMKRGANGRGQTRRQKDRERERNQTRDTDRQPHWWAKVLLCSHQSQSTRGMSQASHVSNCGGLHSTLRLGPRGDLLVTEQSSIQALGEVSGERTMSSVYMCGWDGGGGSLAKLLLAQSLPLTHHVSSLVLSFLWMWVQARVSEVSSSPWMWS